jgi:hypothetical protein
VVVNTRNIRHNCAAVTDTASWLPTVIAKRISQGIVTVKPGQDSWSACRRRSSCPSGRIGESAIVRRVRLPDNRKCFASFRRLRQMA